MTSPAAAFAGFRELVIRDSALFERLAVTNDFEVFASLAVQLGAERGFSFTVDDVRVALQAARRAWIERNVL